MEKNRKQTSTDLALATAGIFSMILFSILLMARIIEDREIMDLVSLVTGAAASFCSGCSEKLLASTRPYGTKAQPCYLL